MAECKHEVEEAWCAECNGTVKRQAKEAGDAVYEGVLIERFLVARYDGQCALVPRHPLVPGREIGVAVREPDMDRVGYVCDTCVTEITA